MVSELGGPESEILAQAITRTQNVFCAVPGHAGAVDVAFIGNTSGAYPWEPTYMIDVDIALFAERLDEPLGRWLLAASDRMQDELRPLGIGSEVKVVRGGFKLAEPKLKRPVVVAHLGVFTEATYLEHPVTLRWAWRKYRCRVQPDRLVRLAPAPPGWDDLRELVGRKLCRVEGGTVWMTEWVLPAFTAKVLEFDSGNPMFAEYCFSSANVCARTHARILGREEADHLANATFARWYRQTLLDAPALEELMRLKALARMEGYEGLNDSARTHVLDYLRVLSRHMGDGTEPDGFTSQ